jgi:hypothetical protein
LIQGYDLETAFARDASEFLVLFQGGLRLAPGLSPIMDYRVNYEHSLASAIDDYIAKVPSQVVEGVPANIPRALLPEFITDFILKRSTRIGKIRHLRII